MRSHRDRTLLAGLDPNDFGYRVDADWYDYVIERFETDDWALDRYVQSYWADIQTHLPPERPLPDDAAETFVAWLADNDFADTVEQSTQPGWAGLLRAGVRNAPAEIYDSLAPIFDRLRSDPYD